MTWGETFYNHLSAFTIHDLAQISDWLDESGELYVDLYFRHGAGGTLQYLICSIRDLKLIAQEQSFWDTVIFTIYRGPKFPLRGIADGPFLEQILYQFPEGQVFCIVGCTYYPDDSLWITEANNHNRLVQAFARAWGYPLAIGLPPSEEHDELISVDSWPSRQSSRPNQHTYAPYDADPARYQWIIDLWKD